MRIIVLFFYLFSLTISVAQEKTIIYSNLQLQSGERIVLYSDNTWQEKIENTGLDTTSAGKDKTICAGDSVVLRASSGDYVYLWSTGEISERIIVKPAFSTDYTVTISDVYGESVTHSVSVEVKQYMSVGFSPDVTINRGQSTTLGILGGTYWKWSTGETTEDITVQPTQTTTYTAIIGGGNSCEITKSVTVTVRQPVVKDAPDYVPDTEVPLKYGEVYTIRTPINDRHQDHLIMCSIQHEPLGENKETSFLVHASHADIGERDDEWVIYSAEGKNIGEQVLHEDTIYLSNTKKGKLGFDREWNGYLTPSSKYSLKLVIADIDLYAKKGQVLTNMSNVRLYQVFKEVKTTMIRNPNPNDDVAYISLENEVLKMYHLVAEPYTSSKSVQGENKEHHVYFREIPIEIYDDLWKNKMIPLWRFLRVNDFQK